MNVNLPPAPPGYNQFNISLAFDLIRQAFIPVVSQDEASPRVLLQAPNGTVYEVTVDNSGNLHTAVNTGKTHI